MVAGLDKFREHFAAFADNYVIIGGTACDIALNDTDMKARVTDDIDIVIIVEKMSREFGTSFWNFIRAGEYKANKRRNKEKGGTYTLYRFTTTKIDFPKQIELLSRHIDIIGEPSGYHIEPLPLSDVSSLSAIIMDNDYYNLTVNNSVVEDHLRFADAKALICLKTRAYLNLLSERKSGRQINSKDIQKHKTDVLKLIATASIPEAVSVPKAVFDSIMEYADIIESELPSQSLQDALERDNKDIQVFIATLKDSFKIKEL